MGARAPLIAPTSVEAVVNARLISLKSPIAGEIQAGMLPAPGDVIDSNKVLLSIVNPRADRNRLDELGRALAELNNQRPALLAKRDWARTQYESLVDQTQSFKRARIREREAKQNELAAELAVATAEDAEAQAALKRASALVASGTVSIADHERAKRAAAVSAARVSVSKSRIANAMVELDALREGIFVGDSYNDRPSTAQLADSVAAKISDLDADIATGDVRAKTLASQLAEEEKRYSAVSQFNMTVPISGRVWEVLTAPGEQVAPGQDLVKLLDCSGALVTASVSESVYNHLNVGMPARFRMRDDNRDYAGTIVNLTGISGAAANFAIEPSALTKEPYRVTVAIPGIADGGNCNIGRTGRVYFNNASAGGFSLNSLLP